jgi:hypothetical protein
MIDSHWTMTMSAYYQPEIATVYEMASITYLSGKSYELDMVLFTEVWRRMSLIADYLGVLLVLSQFLQTQVIASFMK